MNHSILMLRLPLSEQSPVPWQVFVCDRKDQQPQLTEFGTLNSVAELHELSGFAQGKVIVLVPGELVSLRSLEMSGKLTPAMLKSIPYRLEEELASDVEELHFAVLDQQEGMLQLAIVEKSLMLLWQEWLEEAGIQWQQCLPDMLALPYREHECSLCRVDDQWLVRSGAFSGAVCDSQWLSSLLSSQDEKQRLKPVNHTPREKAGHLLKVFRPTSINNQCNLLQGSWKAEQTNDRHGRLIRNSILLSLTALGCWLGSIAMNTWQLNQQADHYYQQSRQLYQTLFPDERPLRVVSQLNRKIQQLQSQQTSPDDLLNMLNSLAPLLSRYGQLKPASMSYEHSQRTLRITAQSNNMQSFTQLRDLLAEQHQVSLESLEQGEQAVTGVLVIKGNAS